MLSLKFSFLKWSSTQLLDSHLAKYLLLCFISNIAVIICSSILLPGRCRNIWTSPSENAGMRPGSGVTKYFRNIVRCHTLYWTHFRIFVQGGCTTLPARQMSRLKGSECQGNFNKIVFAMMLLRLSCQ